MIDSAPRRRGPESPIKCQLECFGAALLFSNLLGRIAVFAGLGFLAANPIGAATKVGPEFQVNSHTSAAQALPVIASDSSGNFVVAWRSRYQDGSQYGIFAQRFNSLGVKQGGEFQVNSYTTNEQRYPAASFHSSGNFVIVWESTAQDGASSGVFAQRFDSLGVKEGVEFQVHTFTASVEERPNISHDPSGDFIVVWHGSGVLGQRFDSLGVRQGAAFQINTITTAGVGSPVISHDANGNFVVAWSSTNSPVYRISAQRFASSGVKLGSEFQVNSYTTSRRFVSDVSHDATGGFVITWSSYLQDSSHWGSFAQRYDSLGVKQGGEFQLNSYTTSWQLEPKISHDAEGNFVVTWYSFGQDEPFQNGVFAQAFNSFGQESGPEFQVTATPGSQFTPSVSYHPNGNFVIAWTSYQQDGQHNGVFAQRFCGGDVTAPTDPSSVTSDHLEGQWSNRPFITMEWLGAADDAEGCGLDGYSVLFDSNPTTQPDSIVDVDHITDPHSFPRAVPDGPSYFHLSTCDNEGNCTSTVHRGPYFIDTVAPSTPTGLTSSSHSVGVPTPDMTVDVTWSASFDSGSGVTGYGVAFSSGGPGACGSLNTPTPDYTSPSLASGSWYANVCAYDIAGNISGTASAGPFVITPAGVTVTPNSGLVTTEAGGADTFTVVLNALPTADVTIGISSSDGSEGRPSLASLTFTAANWNVPQSVTVLGMDDSSDDGDQAYSIVTAAAVSTDPNYSGIDPSDVSATNTDDDAAGFTFDPALGLLTSEAGGFDTFTVVLNSEPPADVTLALGSSDASEGAVSPTSVTFTPANWNLPQTVTVTGVDDFIIDGSVAYVVLTGPVTSDDPAYAALDPSDVGVMNADDDVAGITVTPTSGLVTTEGGGSDSFTVVLLSQPLADVTIGFSSSGTDEGTVSPASLTFTAADWNIAQTVTVTGVDDALADGDIVYAIITAPAASADPAYNGFDAVDVGATNQDDDADLSLTLSDFPDPVTAGMPLEYTIDVQNLGLVTATDLTVALTLPGDVSHDSSSGNGWSCGESGGTVTCTRPSLPSGPAPAITTMVTAPTSAGEISADASVSATSVDPDLGNNSDGETTTVQASAMLELSKLVDDPGPVDPGTILTYTLTLTNNGGQNATGTIVVDPVPPQTTYVAASCTTSRGSCTLVGSNVEFQIGSLAASDTATLSFQVVVDLEPPPTGDIVNTDYFADSNETAAVFGQDVTTTVATAPRTATGPAAGGASRTRLFERD